MTKEITERELVILILQRNTYGFSILYDQYAEIIFNVIFNTVQEQVKAEELLEKTFIRIWQDINDFDSSREGLLTWIVNMARRLSIEEDGKYNTANNKAEPQHGHAKATDIAPQDLRAIELVFVQGHSYEEAAGILGVSLDIVKSKIKAALLSFRRNTE